MTTHAIQHAHEGRIRELTAAPSVVHALWLAGGMLLAFLMPFVLADSLGLNRDLYYAIYASGVVGFIALWARTTRQPLLRRATTRLSATLALGIVVGAVLVLMVYRTEDATSRPGGIEFIAVLLWRGVVYGAVDGLLLSVFPILAVFAAFAGTRLLRRRSGTAVVGLIALVASLAMTAVYHAGYSDFRGEKMRKPLTGDVIWSAPTLLTLNPVGAPIAHIALHTSAVMHSYDTDTFLPPHPS
jgi:hypothetical protein